MVGRIKTILGMQVGLGHTVLDGDPPPPLLKGHSPPIFSPYLLRPNGCMDQGATRHGDRPRPRPLCIRRVFSYISEKEAQQPPPSFRPMPIVPMVAHLRYCWALIWSCYIP